MLLDSHLDHDPLLDVVGQLALARDVDGVIGIIRDATRALTGADGVTFVLREGSQCYYADEDAIAPLWKGRRFPLSECISGWVMLRGEPVVVPDIYADRRIPHDAYRPTFVRSLVMVPVRTPDPVAAIGAYWADRHEATREEVRRLQTLAQSAALALANAQLYNDLRASLLREREARLQSDAAVAMRDNFLTMLAHELRQPLAAGTAALSILRAPSGDGTLQRRALDVMGRQIDTMARLVDDLLDASRIVRGESSLVIAPVDLRVVVQNAVDTAMAAVAARDHILHVILPETPIDADVDARRVEQVVVNLLTNAAKYTPPRGRISVEVRQCDGACAITVRDNGEGIEHARLQSIFDLFTRATDSGQPGFGIGLAVARTLAEQHGGTLSVRSDGRGNGAEFRLVLPPRAARAQLA